MGKLLFKADKKYTFSDYFELVNSTEEIAAAFGYAFATQRLTWPSVTALDPQAMLKWQADFYTILTQVTLNSEMAKRDFMIAPILWGIVLQIQAKINVEYFLDIDDKLSGSLDYLLRLEQALIVIEAKKGDLDKGFNQLLVEMIALDKYESAVAPERLYGAVSIGELWRFGVLEREARTIYKDLHTYRVPEDMEQVFLIILGILQKPGQSITTGSNAFYKVT